MTRYETVASYRLQDITQARAHRDKLQAQGMHVFMVRSDGPLRYDGRILIKAAPLNGAPITERTT
jgi:hypothetical protein